MLTRASPNPPQRLRMTENPPVIARTLAADGGRSLRDTLMLWFLLLALVPMGLVAWIGYQQAKTSLTQAAESKLEQAADAGRAFIRNWFDYRVTDLNHHAETRNNVLLLQQLIEGLRKSGLSVANYVTSYDWARRVDAASADLGSVRRRYDYIHDLMLIDTDGNVLYSVARQSDLGTNIFTGPYSSARLATSSRLSLESGQTLFSDLERYAPSGGMTSGFLTTPMLDESGDKIGVFVMQIGITRILERGADKNQLTDDANAAASFNYTGPAGQAVIGVRRNLTLAGGRLGPDQRNRSR